MGTLFVTIFNSILGLSLLFPVLSPLGRELGLREVQIGALSASYALMQLLLGAWWGRLSETVGRKTIMLVGVLGFAGGFGLLGAVAELARADAIPEWSIFPAMLAMRVVGGAFSSAMIPTAQAFASDLTSRENRTQGMAVIGAAFGLAIIVGPGIGAVLGRFVGLTAPIWCSVVFGLLNAILVVFALKEPEQTKTRPVPARGTMWRVALRAWPLLVVALASTGSSLLMEQTVGFLVEDRLGLTHDETPAYLGLALVAYGVIAVAVQGGLARRVKVSPSVLLLAGMPFTIAGFVVLMTASGLVGIVCGMALQGFGQGLVLPGVTGAMSLAVDEDEQGIIAGLNSSAQALGRLAGPLLGTRLYETAIWLPYGVGALLVGASLLFVASHPRIRGLSVENS